MTFLLVLLIIGVLFLTGKSAVLLKNRLQFRGLAALQVFDEREAPSVSICIPARNEEKVIGKCVQSALNQDYPDLHVYVLDDRSTDNTAEIIAPIKNINTDKLTVLNGQPKPGGWLGKPWACHQLSQNASGDILLFIDADTWLESDSVSRLMGAFNESNVDFITVWPQQFTRTFWEMSIVPLVYYALLGFLPVKYTERKPRWMPQAFHNRFRSLFAAACGQFMAFRIEAYRAIGGHESVKDKIVEDVALARKVLKQGYRMRMFHGVNAVYCRMYENQQELFQGFRKNFLAGFDYNIPLFLMMSAAHFTAYLLPVAVLLGSLVVSLPDIILLLALINFTLMVIHRFILARWFKWPVVFALLHPIGVIWFQILGFRVLLDRLFRLTVYWKGDDIQS